MPCTACRKALFELLTLDFSGPDWRSKTFDHGHLVDRRAWAAQGCEICSFTLQMLKGNPGGDGDWVEWIGDPFPQKVDWCGSIVELFTPSLFGFTEVDLKLFKTPDLDITKDRIIFGTPVADFKLPILKDLPPRLDDPACFDSARELVHACAGSHPQCTRPSNPQLPTRVIDVGPPDGSQQPFLQEYVGGGGRYVTLSHRWGQNLTLKTTQANINEHRKRIELSQMPATFKDAVMVTKRLGLRYLWIDSLCIIQDSKADWAQEAAHMASIYANSYLTISALSSGDSNGGLFRQRKDVPSIFFKSPAVMNGLPEVLGMRIPLPSVDTEMEASPINPRGWIFQERLLSPAMLHYGATQIFYECRTTVLTETQAVAFANPYPTTQVPSWHFNLGQIHDFYSAMDLWYTVVKTYSSLELSFKSDRLAAIMGIADEFKKHVESDFLVGVFLRDLAMGLYWSRNPRYPVPSEPAQTRFPTWSWTSVDYPVSYPMLSDPDWRSDIRLDEGGAYDTFDLAKYSHGLGEVVLRLRGTLLEIDSNNETRPMKGTFLAIKKERGHDSFEARASLDPHCGMPSTCFLLPVMSRPRYDNRRAFTAFLVLQRLSPQTAGAPSPQEMKFIRIGTGSYEPSGVSFFQDIPGSALILV
jgi:Heterokaryon incompatibility protein (HET)